MSHDDLPPLKAFILTLGKLRYAKSRQERESILAFAEQLLPKKDEQEPAREELSTLAKRILAKCEGQQVNTKTIARLAGVSPSSGHLFVALNELHRAGHLTKLDKGLYQFQPPASAASSEGAENSESENA